MQLGRLGNQPSHNPLSEVLCFVVSSIQNPNPDKTALIEERPVLMGLNPPWYWDLAAHAGPPACSDE